MDGTKIGQAGSLESNDLMVTVDLSERNDLEIEIESIVKKRFGKQIKKVTQETLQELGVNNGYVKIVDRGALDFAIRARLKTAVRRAKGVK